MNNYHLHFNFLAAREQVPRFKVYRKLRGSEEKSPDRSVHGYRLKVNDNQEAKWAGFWVSLGERDSFSPYDAEGRENFGLTKRILLSALAQRCDVAFGKGNYRAFEGGFSKEVAICTARHAEGEEEIIFQPYFLEATDSFGFLVDYHFRLNREVPFSRKILQLSLSLDQQTRPKPNSYAAQI